MTVKKILGVALMIGVLATPAFAAFEIKINTNGPFGTTTGGQFTATTLNNSIPGQPTGSMFQTYCIERGENLSSGTHNYWATLNTAAVKGGQAISDPLDSVSAYIYQYYGPQVDESVEADFIQYALWTIEGEGSFGGQLANATAFGQQWTNVGAFITQMSNEASNANFTGGFLGNVRVLNIWGDSGATVHKQDILVVVPVPGAALLGALGLGMVGWLKRR